MDTFLLASSFFEYEDMEVTAGASEVDLSLPNIFWLLRRAILKGEITASKDFLSLALGG